MSIKATLWTGVIIASLASSAVSASDQVVLSEGLAKSGSRVVAIDLAGAEKASAFSFVIQLPRDARNVNIENCTSELPKSHTARCEKVTDTRVAVIGWSPDLTALGADIVAVGKVVFDSVEKGPAAVVEASLSEPK